MNPWNRARATRWLGIATVIIGFCIRAAGADIPAPPETRIAVAVLPLGLSPRTQEVYPQLAERQVGLGVHNRLVEQLHATGWFQLVEEKEGVIDDLLNRQWIASSGAIAPESAVQIGRLQGARYVLYGEVYDFRTYRVSRKEWEVSIAIQVRLVDVETSVFIPAMGEGAVLTRTRASADGTSVARRFVGQVSEEAIGQAVGRLLEVMNRQLLEKGEF